MHAEKTLTRVSRDYRKYAREMAIMKNSMDRASEIYSARLEGISEGRVEGQAIGRAEGQAIGKAEGQAIGKAEGQAIGKAEGIVETNLEVARKMKAMGDSAEKIHAITGLPAETIESL